VETTEQGEQSYYPGARIRLIIRFDDPSRKRFNRLNPAKFPITRANGVRAKPFLQVTRAPDGSYVVAQPGADILQVTPHKAAASEDLLSQPIEGIIPIRATLSLNGVRSASTLSCEIAFADLPVEPRMVRGVAIEYFLGTITADEFRRGIAGETRESGDGNATPLNLIPKEYTDGFGRPRTNLRFQGWVDSWEVNFAGDSQPTVKLECRDNTTLLIDTQTPPMLTINPDKPLDQAFADYLAFFPQFTGLRVLYLPTGEQAPIPRKVLAKNAMKTWLGPAAGNASSIWDYFTDVAGSLGHMVRFEGATVLIQRSRAIYGTNFPRRADDPYQIRQTSARSLPFRLFVYGRNVAEWNMKRKFTVAGPTTIEVDSYIPRLKRKNVVRYPLKKDRRERGLPGSLLPDEKIQVFHAPVGIESIKTLTDYAQNIYEQLGRNECELTVRTKDLGSFGGSLLDPDLLDCKVGDNIQFEVARDEQSAAVNTTSASENADASFQSAFEYIKKFGYTDAFARAYAQAVQNRHEFPIFRVKRMDFDWSFDQGIDITVAAVNYLQVEPPSDNTGTGTEGRAQVAAHAKQTQTAPRQRAP